MKEYYGDVQPKLPSPREAEKVALTFLRQNRLLPEKQDELKLVHSGGLRAQNVIGGRRAGPVINKMITLTYGREIDSLPVIGPGSKLIVNVGNQGEIVSLVKRWRELDPASKTEAKPEEIISKEEAQKKLAENMVKNFGKDSRYEVISTQKAYYDGDGRTLQPVYVFETKVTLPDKSAEPFQYVSLVNILKNPAESVEVKIDPEALRAIKEQPANGETPQPTDRND